MERQSKSEKLGRRVSSSFLGKQETVVPNSDQEKGVTSLIQGRTKIYKRKQIQVDLYELGARENVEDDLTSDK